MTDLRAAVRQMFTNPVSGRPTKTGWYCTNEIAEQIRDALAVEGAPIGGDWPCPTCGAPSAADHGVTATEAPEPVIDEERLARALQRWWDEPTTSGVLVNGKPWLGGWDLDVEVRRLAEFYRE